jgi:hypothetical protein
MFEELSQFIINIPSDDMPDLRQLVFWREDEEVVRAVLCARLAVFRRRFAWHRILQQRQSKKKDNYLTITEG